MARDRNPFRRGIASDLLYHGHALGCLIVTLFKAESSRPDRSDGPFAMPLVSQRVSWSVDGQLVDGNHVT